MSSVDPFYDEDSDEPDVVICRSWLDPVVWYLVLDQGYGNDRSHMECPSRLRRLKRHAADTYTPKNATSTRWVRVDEDTWRLRWVLGETETTGGDHR